MPDLEAIISRVYDQGTQSIRISGLTGGGGDGDPHLIVSRGDVTISDPTATLDFSTEFTVSQSPVGEANVGIGTAIARQATIDALTQADIPYDGSGWIGNLDPGIIVTGQDLADYLDGVDLSGGGTLDTSNFDNNLDPTIDTNQKFADYFDDFVFPGTGTVITVNDVAPDLAGDVHLQASDIEAIDIDQLGVANGVATLDALGILDLAQWPQFVTDINGYNGGSVNLLASDILADDTGWTGNLLGVTADVASALQAFNDFTPTASADGHEIRDTGGAFTFRTGLKFSDYFAITDDLVNDETDVDVDLTALGAALGTGGAVAPFDATYLTTTSNGSLSNEVVVGTTPGGELGGTWASPTVDATHSGSSHASVQAAAEATAAAALATVTSLDLLVGTATGVLSGEIVVGTSPGGELGGTWASPTVDTTHSGSSHASIQSAAEATAAAALIAHIADLTSAHSATGIDFTPVGTISSTDVQAAIAEVAAEAATFTASGFDGNFLTTDDTFQEIVDKLDSPTRWTVGTLDTVYLDVEGTGTPAGAGALNAANTIVAGSYTATADPTTIAEGTALLVHQDQVLNYNVGGIAGPNHATALRPANWAALPGSSSFPRGHVTLEGTTTAQQNFGLLGGGVGYIDLRVTKNVASATTQIAGYQSFISNHTYMADGGTVSWVGSGNWLPSLNNYYHLGFTDQPMFTNSSANGGTLTGTATSFYSGPLAGTGATLSKRFGLYVDDATAAWDTNVAAFVPGTTTTQVGIHIQELVSGATYNIPIQYSSDPNPATTPLFKVAADGFVHTPAVIGLGAFGTLGIKPNGTAGSSDGSLIIDARNMQLGPTNAYSHSTSTAFQLMQVANTATITMNSTASAGIFNTYGGVTLAGTISFQAAGSSLGSAMFSATNTFTASSGISMGTVYGAFLAPAFTGVGAMSVTHYGFSSSPTFTGSGGTFTAAMFALRSSPTVNDADVTASRTAVLIDEINGSSGTITSNIGIDIAAFTRGSTMIGIRNASTTVLSGGLYGSTAAAGGLTIGSTTNASKGTITFSDPVVFSDSVGYSGNTTFEGSVELRPTNATLTAIPGWFFADGTYTLNFTNANAGTYQTFSPTIINQQSAYALGNVVGYRFSPTVKNLSSVAANYGPIGAFFSQPTVNVDTQTGLTLSALTEYRAAALFTQTASGTATTTFWSQFSAGGDISAGHTITTRRGVYIEDITGAGTGLVDNIGIDIAAQAKGTGLNVGIRNAATSVLSGGVYGSTAAAGGLSINSTTNASKGNITLVDQVIASTGIAGSTASGGDLILLGTTHATTGTVFIAGSTTPANSETVIIQGAASYGAGTSYYSSVKPAITSLTSAGDLMGMTIIPTFDVNENTASTTALKSTAQISGDSTVSTGIGVDCGATLSGTATATELIGARLAAYTAAAGATATTGIALSLECGEVLTLGTMTTGVLLRALTNSATSTKWGFQFGNFDSYHQGPLMVGTNSAVAGGQKLFVTGNIGTSGSVLSASATAGVGYATGAGGTASQTTNKSTAFPTISKACGTLTWNNAALGASTNITTASSTNTAIAATDTVIFNHISGGTLGSYTMTCTPGSGTWTLTLRNVSTGSLSEAPVFAFAIIKAVTS